MAKIQAGILSPPSGKIGGVVGGSWKKFKWIREYVIPANPKTAAQTVQRTKFSDTVDFCKPLVGPIFNVFTDVFQAAMSGYNFFIKRNIAIFVPVPSLNNVKITEGKLHTPAVQALALVEAADTCTFQTGVPLGSNGKVDDTIFAACYNRTTNLWAFPAATWERQDGGTPIVVSLKMAAGDVVFVWAFAAQYVGTKLDIISDSDNDSDTA